MLTRLVGSLLMVFFLGGAQDTSELVVRIRGDAEGASGFARLYVTDQEGRACLASPSTRVVNYDVQRGNSIERHSAVAGEALFRLPPGRYEVLAECGKEFIPETRTISLRSGEHYELELTLRRWIHMAEKGWFSADTHIHRAPGELRVAQPAEDLNFTFPLTFWVHESTERPLQSRYDVTDRVMDFGTPTSSTILRGPYRCYTVNTEYEVFTIRGRRHVLGAFFVLGHAEPLDFRAPPVGPIFDRAHQQGALIDLDKHNWPWSPILAALGADLYELANNHMWRAPFYFRRFGTEPPPHWNIDTSGDGIGEKGWIEYTHRMYWTLLNLGLRLAPAAGTASGVHPVPPGFGRVYVKLTGEPTVANFLAALKQGRSFVTTGPMLDLDVQGMGPGEQLNLNGPQNVTVRAEVRSLRPCDRVELILNGELREPDRTMRSVSGEVHVTMAYWSVPVARSGWLAARAWIQTADGRPRFAHTGPVHVLVRGTEPPPPDRRDVEHLVRLVRHELERSRSVLPPTALEEYRQARQFYERFLGASRN